jgi:hypothetical protein
MDVTTVNNAVSDALAGLPAGTSSFINDNIGTAAGQQAIYNAGVSLGLSQAQIAAAVSQATGQTVTPQQVAQVAATVAAPAAPAAPVNAPQFVGTPAPGAVGTNYGQASTAQIANTQQSAPDLATALQNGTAKMTYDGNGVPYLYDSKSGQQINGNYQIQVGQNGQLGINLPSANGSMVQVATKLNQDGSLAPVNASNVLNVGVNQGAGGFGGGLGGMTPILGAGLAIASMGTLIPYIAAYNAADAVNKKKYGAAILSAAVAYGGFNPDSQLANLLKTGADVPTDPSSGQPLVDSQQPVNTSTGTDLSQVGNNAPVTNTTGTPISQVGNTTGTYIGANGEVVPIPNYNPTNPIDATGLNQNFGAGAITAQNLAGMNTAYTNAMANGGYTSGYQTLPNGNRVMIQNDGSAIGITPGGGTYKIDQPSVQTLVNQGQLNSAASGYNVATGGTPIAPGGGTINTNGTTTLPSGATVNTPLNSVAAAAPLISPSTALIGGSVLNTLGALNTNKAIANAAGTQAQAGQAAQSAISDFGKSYGQLQAPYQNTGVQATNAIGSLGSGTYNIMNPDGTVAGTGMGSDYLTHQFNAKDLQAGLAPNYDFMLAQGAGANRNLANASGGQISGNTLQGLNTFNQNYASNAYQNAFNNYQTQRQNIYQNLAGQAGIGGTSLGQLGSVGANLANTYGNVTTGLAASQAGAQTAQAVNTQNALSNIGQTALLTSLIKPA